MAAYAALVSLLNDLELIPNHPTHFFSFDNKQITTLAQIVHSLIDFMDNYASHGCTTQVMESRIASAAHAAHDVIESHVVDQIHAGTTIPGKTGYYFLDFVKKVAKNCESTLAGKAGSYFLIDLQKAIDNMDSVKREVMQFKAQNGLKAEHPTYISPSSSQPPKILMVGFDAALLQLLEKLTGEPSDQLVIPIMGMGGIGKTTLAKNAYEHLLIQRHFDVRLWATISQQHNTTEILKELLFRDRRSASGGDGSQLGLHLYKMLWDRRYLIVLDDMWSLEAWDRIKCCLPDNSNGSCVIVTSRLSNLAAQLSPFPFKMNFLDDEMSWELLCGNVFGEAACPLELEQTGRRIVKRCRGLPLSIVVIGGHLRKSPKTIEYWEKVADSMNPISTTTEDEQCLNIISLSYEHLPAYLKPCFLYMGIYPEDGWIDAFELIKFWVAEGFIKPKQGTSVEEVAEGYLKDLIDMNLIFVRERRWNGKAEICVIHDIVRELCLKVAEREKFLVVVEDTTQATGKERRVVIPMELSRMNLYTDHVVRSPPLLRSLIGRGGNWFADSANLRLMRLLVYKMKNYYAAFSQVNLRYLAFSCERPANKGDYPAKLYLPSSMSQFWNMQTLIIHNYDVKVSATFNIWEMPQLRHFEFVRVHLRDPVPGERSNQLRNLHTLIGIANLRLTDEVCIRIPNVKKLSIRYDDFPCYSEAISFYCPQNFGRLGKLESLSCSFGVGSKWRDVALSLRLPSSVEELSLQHSQLHWGEVAMMTRSLPCLGSLALDSIRGSEWDLVEEKFSCLRVLRISRCDDLIDWKANSSHFPVLEILHISEVPKLKEIPLDIGEIPTLARIELIGSNASVAVSAMHILVEQESLENEDIQLDVGFWGPRELEMFQNVVHEERGLTTTSTSISLSFQTNVA